MPQMTLENICKDFLIDDAEIKAVVEINLSVEKGDFISVVGHSGSGKTTLLSLMGGILKPTSGRLCFEGADIYALDDDRLSEYRAAKIGYIFQSATLLPVLTAKENLLLPCLFLGNGRPGPEKESKAEEYLRLVGLEEKINAYPHQLSGGQQRRVAIARAFMNDPGLILADEPTGDLDEQTESEIMKLFKKVNAEAGLTFILVTHSTGLASEAKRRFRMSNGRLHEIT